MSILTDVEIKNFIESNSLIKDASTKLISSSSYDLRIGTIFRNGKIINDKYADPVIVQPGEVVTMLTLETLDLPADIAGTAYAINSQSLDGFLVLNPGHVDPGYKGTLSIKALNLRKKDVPICLSIGDKIFTIVFQKLAQDVEKPYSVLETEKSRGEREKIINKNEVEKSMESVADLLAMSKEDIDRQIEQHQSTKLNNALVKVSTCVVLVTFVITVWPYLFPATKDNIINNNNTSQEKVLEKEETKVINKDKSIKVINEK